MTKEELEKLAAETEESSVFAGLKLVGRVNVDDPIIEAQVEHAIRQSHPQLQWQPENDTEIVLVGSGPSLNDRFVFEQLRDLVYKGAKLVTLNGAYEWCLRANLKPSAQIVLDARPSTARFVTPEVPNCRYYIARQCHADVWNTVKDYEHVGIWHAVAADNDILKPVLDRFYTEKHWHGVSGGTTVATRAVGLLRMLGFLRFHIFGVDSCWMGSDHHAVWQPENAQDRKFRLTIGPTDGSGPNRIFTCSEWHLKQAEDFIQFIQTNGEHFLLEFYGDGMLAYMLQAASEMKVTIAEV